MSSFLSFSVSTAKPRTWPRAQRSQTAHTMTVSTHPHPSLQGTFGTIRDHLPTVYLRKVLTMCPEKEVIKTVSPFLSCYHPIQIPAIPTQLHGGTVPGALTPVPQSKSNCLWMTTTAHVMVSLDSSSRKWQRPSKESRFLQSKRQRDWDIVIFFYCQLTQPNS